VRGPELVTDQSALQDLLARMAQASRYGLDTEFQRERTYWPQLALLQLAWSEGPAGEVRVALVDPLAVDVSPLAGLLEGAGTMVAHASEQDLEVLERACGTRPRLLLDTQVAAGFAGHGSASLSSLVQRYLGVRMAKGDRLADWSRRPLRPSELAYAAADVQYLLPLADAIVADLDGRGRRTWAEEECELVRTRPRGPVEPERAWWKLRDSRQLRGASRGVAQELAAWRERRARQLDVPPRQVIPDLALQALAARPPDWARELSDVRGLDPRYLRDGVGGEIMAAVARGASLDVHRLRIPPAQDVSKELRPAVALAAAWVSQLAQDYHIDAALLATRSDLVAFLRGDGDSRLARGWRQEMVGRPLRRLVDGEAALAYQPGGRLALEERSGRPVPTAW
jgi:ribonuclease D